MRIPINRAVAIAALAIASSACAHTAPIGLNPNLMRELHTPEVGQTRAAVVALNGDPDRVEQAESLEVWVYSRTLPAVPDLRSRAAIVWFRDGVVVRVASSGGFSAPEPTFPAPRPLPLAAGADAS